MSLNTADVQTTRWSAFPTGAKHHEVWNDFVDAAGPGITSTPIANGTVSHVADLANGVVRLANNGSDDDSGAQLQGSMESIALATSKETWAECRLALSDATQSSLFVGLSVTDASIQHASTDTLAAGLTCTDAIGVYKPDGEATLYGVVRRDSIQASTGSLGSLSDATYHVLGVRVSMTASAGAGTAYFYLDGVLLGQIFSTTMPYSAEEVLALSVAWKSGAAAAKTCDVDYLGALVER